MITSSQLLPNNPKANYLAHKDEIDAAIAHFLDRGRYILGQEVENFENEFASFIGVCFAVGVASGTDALHLALRACGLGAGDQIITVSHTAVGTVAGIEACGATPVLVDIDSETFTIDPGKIEAAITKQTKAIIPVHLYGHPADMESIMSVAHRHELLIIEDCAQSHGAEYKGRKTGAWGNIAALSFYPTKNLGALGDGGMVLTDDPKLAEQVRLLREYGWCQRYISEFPGLNSRLDELQAAILRVKLSYLDEENQKRRDLADIYDELLSNTSIKLPASIPGTKHVYHQYVVRSKYRDNLRSFLQEKGIRTLIHYPVPIHQQHAYKKRLRCVGSRVNTNKVVREILSLPIYPELTSEQINQVIKAIITWDHEQGS